LRRAAWLAWTLAGVALAAAVAGNVLLMASGSTANAGHGNALIRLALPCFAIVGALIVARQPDNLLGWLFCFEGVSAALTTNGLGYGYVHYAVFGPGHGLPAGEWVAWLSGWVNFLGFANFPLALLLFPTGRPPSPRWQPLVLAGAVLTVLAGVSSALRPGPMWDFPDLPNPAGLSGSAGSLVLFFADVVVGGLVTLLWLVAAFSVLLRLRRSGGVERQQIKWFAYAATVAAVYYACMILVGVALPDVNEQHPTVGWLIGTVGWGLAVDLLPVSIGIAILRYRLFDIDLIIRSTLVYGVLTGLLALLYWACVVVLQQPLRPLTQGSELAIVASTLAVAALFQPARRWIQTLVDQRFYRSKYNAARTLEDFSAHLREEVDLESLGAELLAVVGQTMEPTTASLWLRPHSRSPQR
jgi:hypothetical protein